MIFAILSSSHCAEAKEIVATNEWQLIEEGDSIPKGLHVRMDMTTGEKWAKLLDEEGDAQAASTKVYSGSLIVQEEKKDSASPPKAQASLDQAIKITHLANAELTAEASAKITSQLLEQSQREANMRESIASLNDFEADNTKDELEYEMMYRTLLSLPVEEHETMGRKFPAKLAQDASPIEKAIFESKVRAIWSARQDLLKQMEDEYLVDVAGLIADRIQFLQDYVANPMQHVRDVLALRESQDDETDNNGNSNLSTITGVLKDLEFQLTDLDNARDFHNMGGWPFLVAFLTDSIHGLEYELQEAVTRETQALGADMLNATDAPVVIDLSQDTIQFLTEYQKVVWEIQGLACWCMGTAVKNVEEFHAWATEDFSDLMARSADGQDTNVITIILNKLHAESTRGPSILGISAMDSKLQMRRKYEMYALGSLLRGNSKAIHYFGSVDGPSILYDLFTYLTLGVEDISEIDSTTLKLLGKVISLADDLLMDVTLHPTVGSDGDNQLVSALTTSEWCMAPMQMMKHPSINVQRKMLETMINTAPHCSYRIEQILEMITADGSDELDEDLDALVNRLREIL